MELTQENIKQYLDGFVRHPHPILATLEADALERRVPIIGSWGGRILALLARHVQAQRILELGTATGYSAIWMATATAAWAGTIVTIDSDATRVREAQANFVAAGIDDRVRIVQGLALTALRDLTGPFDLIFNDLLFYLQSEEEAEQLRTACLTRLRPGGLLLCDNALRGGKVMDANPDTGALSVRAFTEGLLQDPQLDTTLIPIRDGLLLCHKHEGTP